MASVVVKWPVSPVRSLYAMPDPPPSCSTPSWIPLSGGNPLTVTSISVPGGPLVGAIDTDGGIGVGEGFGVSVGAAVGVAVGVAVGAGRVAVDVSVGVGVGSLWMPAQLTTINDSVTTVKSFNIFASVFILGSDPP